MDLGSVWQTARSWLPAPASGPPAAEPAGRANGDPAGRAEAGSRPADASDGPPEDADRAGGFELAYRSRDRATLTITTRDGDRVRLAFTESTRLAMESGDGGDTASLELELRSRVRLSVRGEFDAGELEAVRAVAERAAELVIAFREGGLGDAFAEAARLDADPEALADVALRASRRTRLMLAGPAAGPPDRAPAVSAERPSSPGTPATSPAPTEAAAPAPASDSPAGGETPASVLERVVGFLRAVLEALEDTIAEDERGEADAGARFDFRLRVEIFRSAMAAVVEPEGAPPLLDPALDAAAQRLEPLRVDDRA